MEHVQVPEELEREMELAETLKALKTDDLDSEIRSRSEWSFRMKTLKDVAAVVRRSLGNTLRWVRRAEILGGVSQEDRISLVHESGLPRYLINVVHRTANGTRPDLNMGFGCHLPNFAPGIPFDCADIITYICNVLVPKARQLKITDTEFDCLKTLALLDGQAANLNSRDRLLYLRRLVYDYLKQQLLRNPSKTDRVRFVLGLRQEFRQIASELQAIFTRNEVNLFTFPSKARVDDGLQIL